MTTDEGRGPAGFPRRPREARTLLVTGTSGAGRSSALAILEDIGCAAIDKLPPPVPSPLAHAAAPAPAPGIAARTRGFGIAAMLKTRGEADPVFAVRFLADSHYAAHPRPLCGRDPPVAAPIAADAEFEPFFDRLWQLLRPLPPRYEREGKAYPTIAIDGLPVAVAHHDLPASGSLAPAAAPAPVAAD